jgi:hypothetical protein
VKYADSDLHETQQLSEPPRQSADSEQHAERTPEDNVGKQDERDAQDLSSSCCPSSSMQVELGGSLLVNGFISPLIAQKRNGSTRTENEDQMHSPSTKTTSVR